MEKEKIIKALERVQSNGKDTAYNAFTTVTNALALIKELTEEIERLEKAKYIYATVDYCADDLANALEENKRLTEENERLKSEVSVKKKLLDKCVDLEDRVKADTLNDMQTRFAMHFGTYRPTDEVKVTEVFKLLKKISEEMLYEEEEE